MLQALIDPLPSAAGGLGGHGAAHQHALLAFVAVLFGVAVAVLVFWFRRASRASEIEELDRFLDED